VTIGDIQLGVCGSGVPKLLREATFRLRGERVWNFPALSLFSVRAIRKLDGLSVFQCNYLEAQRLRKGEKVLKSVESTNVILKYPNLDNPRIKWEKFIKVQQPTCSHSCGQQNAEK
jgi:hypothetical protein